jgi:hypothetical protein
VSYAAGLPILLVTPTSIPSETSAAMTDLGIQHAIILGGTAAVSDAVKTQLDAKTGSTSDRVAGTTRFGTARAVGEWAVDNLGWDPTEIELASGVNFPDALAGGPLGGERQAPILLLASAPADTTGFADDHSDTITDVNCLGGTAACAEADLQTVATAAENTGNDEGVNQTATDLPELVSAKIMSTRTAAQATPGAINQAGTVVRFTFDEPITGAAPDPSLFWVYENDTAVYDDGAAAQVVSGDNKSVDILFEQYDEQALANNLVVATVERDAVTDGTGDTNPEGDAGISTGTANPVTAGVTAAPDVTGASRFTQAFDANNVVVDVTFDQPAFVQDPNGFFLELTDNSEVQCLASTSESDPSGNNIPGGSGTTKVTVECGDVSASGDPLTPSGAGTNGANVARVIVAEGAVARNDVPDNPNPLEAADVSNGGNTSGPDLVTAIFSPDAVAGADIVAYVFDEPISDPALASTGDLCGPNAGNPSVDFAVYMTDGSQTNGPACVQRAANNDSVVLAAFADHTLDDAVGVAVEDSAVTGFKTGGNANNRRDEVGVAPVAGSAITTGHTGAPDLIKVEIQPYTDALGVAKGRAIFTFDEDVPDSWAIATGVDADPGSFHLYDVDGEQLNCLALETQTAAARASDREVVCSNWEQDDSGDPATTEMVRSAKLGTVEYDAVEDADGNSTPEGAEVTTARA